MSITKSYERPVLARRNGGLTNKFGHPAPLAPQEELEGVPVSELIARYGSPLFAYSQRTIGERHRELTEAFATRYPRTQHAWSYKTNYLKAVCQEFHQLGSWAEVVSAMEYEMARRLGVPGSKIIFNGPHKPYAALKQALGEGARVNVDNFDELEDVVKIADELGIRPKIGIRLNMSLGSCMSWDRYGFNIESGEALEALGRALQSGKVQIAGFHAHIGTFVTDVGQYRAAVRKLVGLARLARAEFGIRLEYLDIGGGFASKNRLKGIYLSTAENAPDFEDYAEAICQPLLEGFAPDERPLLILESGRAMIDDAGSLVSTVVATKRLSSGKRGLVLDAGVNVLFTAFWYDHEIIPTADRGQVTDDHVIHGNLCMQIDVIRDHIRLPMLERGDSVVIRPVGAYNNTQWMQFIALRPNVVMIGENGQVTLIREAETVEYLQQGERLPEWTRFS